MTFRTLGPAEFRQLMLNELPELAGRFSTPRPDVHADARALYQYVAEAIESIDVDRTIRALSLVRRLNRVENQLDVYAVNALWLECASKIPQLKDYALRMTDQIEWPVMKTLYWPFKMPPVPFAERELASPCEDAPVVTILKEAEHRARLARQFSSPGRFGDITLRLAPRTEDNRVMLTSIIPGDREVPREMMEEVHDELLRQLAAHCTAGRRFVGISITIVDLIYHDVDTRAGDVATVTGEAFNASLALAGVHPA